MMKKISAILALVAASGVAAFTASAGDIFDVHACDRNGISWAYDNLSPTAPYATTPYSPEDPMAVGTKAYFKIRFAPPMEDTGYSTNTWDFIYTGISATQVLQPQIGIYVSGELTYATYVGKVRTVAGQTPAGDDYYFTDIIFEYLTKPGDFALPIVLAMDQGGETKPANWLDTDNPGTCSYHLNPWLPDWRLCIRRYEDDRVDTAVWQIDTTRTFPGAKKYRDVSLAKADYCVRTVDFSSTWEEKGVLWRSVHEGSSVTEKYDPELEAKSASEEAKVFFVWSLNEAAVRIDGKEVTSAAEWEGYKERKNQKEPIWRSIAMPDPDHPSEDPTKWKTYRVGMVLVPGEALTGGFSLWGVSTNAAGGKAELVLSAFDSFHWSPPVGDIADDFVTVPVKCVESLPPSVTVKSSVAVATAGYEYGKAAARLTVSLPTQADADKFAPFKVTILPQITNNAETTVAEWGEYVRFGTQAEYAKNELPRANEPPSVTLGGGVKDATVFVFCLRADLNTTGTNLIWFEPSAPDKPAEITALNGVGINVEAQIPDITEPAEGSKIEGKVYQFTDYPIDIRVEGSYADSLTATGYTVRVRYDNGDFEALSGTYYPNASGGNLLLRTGTTTERPALRFTSSGEDRYADIEVIAPVSGRKSSEPDTVYRRIYADVRQQKTASISITDKAGEEIEEIAEGTAVNISISVSEPNVSQTMYAFLKPSEGVVGGQFRDTQVPFILGMTNANGKCEGLEIRPGQTVPTKKTRTVTLLDGYASEDSGLPIDFEVVLSTKKSWPEATNSANIVQGYASDVRSITVTNVAPTITKVTMDPKDPVSASGGKFKNMVAAGQSQVFHLTVNEPSSYDKTHDRPSLYEDDPHFFTIEWTTYLDDGVVDTGTLTGDPDKIAFTNLFDTAGLWTIEFNVKDKDMYDFDEEKVFSVNLEVSDNPTIVINGDTDHLQSRTYLEYETAAQIELEPSFWPNDADLTNLHVVVTTEYWRVDGTGDWGEFVLETNEIVFTKRDHGKRILQVLKLDGTDNTMIQGLRVTAAVTDTAVSEKAGVPWKDYFIPGWTRVFVENVEPNRTAKGEQKSFDPDANTNVWEVAGGAATSHPLRFYVRTDVDRDFEYNPGTAEWTTNGIRVTIMGGGGESYNADGFVNGVKYFDGPATGTFVPNFGSSQGDQDVIITIEDKDGGQVSRTWKFTVTPSKFLTTVATGPSGGTSSSSLSQKYIAFEGIGEGHVFALDKTFVSAKDFRLGWNCSKDAKAQVFAWGYKVGALDDGTLDAHDQAIDRNGNAAAGEAIANPYPYGDPLKDSFLYCWIQTVTDDSGQEASAYLGSLAPERAAASGPSSAFVTLPAEASEDKTYPETTVEAIFSKERFVADNCGDINQDGIPDVYVSTFNFGLLDETTGEVLDGANDRKSLKAWNGDLDKDDAESPDFLPGYLMSAYGTIIPGTKEKLAEFGAPFTAYLEIRGYGDGLNDAPEQAGIHGVKPDRVYEDPTLSPTSTLSAVEFLAWSEYAAANKLDPADTNAWTKWSPERPTSPVLDDTDGDGFTDGLEYYFWYRAHVGYMDGNVHRYQTGRIYDPRNPGEGRLIPAKVLALLMDPRVPRSNPGFDPTLTAEERALLTELSVLDPETADTDNDGLPDLLELLIGTNPLDFDTDGDGLPDGWEICNVGNLDPLDPASHLDGKSDTERNSDGDAMAIASYALEQQQKPVPLDIRHAKRTTFAVIDPNGDTDGVQWYAVAGAPADVAVETVTNGPSAVTFKADGRDFVWYGERLPVTAGGLLAATLAKGNGTVGAYVAGEQSVVTNVSEDETVTNVFRYAARGYPVRVPAGTPVTGVTTGVCPVVVQLAADIKAADANACWIYGKGPQNALYGEVAKTAADYGCLALGRQLAAKKGAVVCALPDDTRDVAFLHYLVYQEFGFDPRTAWKAKDPLATRWSKSIDGESVEGITQLKQGGYTGAPSRTRDYANYDEFLVYSFFVNNGCKMSGKTRITDPKADPLVVIWDMFTTNPQGPNEILPETSGGTEGGETAVTSYGRGTNGADTDFDGVPDGWELYVMAGPKKDGAYVFAHPYAGFATGLNPAEEMPESYFSPFLDFAKGTETSNQIYLGGEGNDDTLNEFKEFEGTDSIAYYAVAAKEGDLPYSTTVVHEGNWTWFNKFFPTDPWAVDTDQDGLSDSAEKGAFAYGTPADDGKLWSIPGGGLNPCSVDTDLDGLPDPWELQFKPENYSNVYAGEFADYAKDETGAAVGNPLQGLTDGMDGTVKDAFSYPIEYADSAAGGTNVTTYVIADGFRQVVNRDYDRDGLENWQEYLTGTMRCWRYDDPLSSWSYIPKELYFKHDEKTDTWTFKPDYAALGVEDRNEFWHRTLVDRSSPLYNPGLVTDSSPAMYFSRVVNPWDCAYLDATLSGTRPGAYYWFKDRIGADKLTDLWGEALLTVAGDDTLAAPSRYASCSPIDSDSDHDGMDDYYELFHGMNPLLGKSGVRMAENGPCDLVYDSWTADGGDSFSAWGGPDGKKPNFWQLDPGKTAQAKAREGSNGYDFEVYPWLNGLADADPDGDILPNQEEALLPKLSKIAFHTDPTPVWMTDTSYSNSLTRMFFRLPARFEDAATGGATFTFGGETNAFSSFDGWVPAAGMTPAHFAGFIPDAWTLAAAGEMNWMYSFEENEGYDSDHDGISDFEEKEGLFRTATDPQDADSPRRRQAMYFQGPSKPSALQTMPFVDELYPTQRGYPDDIAFVQFSAECWVKPESLADSIVLERAVWTGLSSPADAEYMRKNFQLGIRTGADGRSYWFAKYDPVGTADDTHEVVALSKSPADATKWTHLAATYDGTALVLYVNGKESRTVKSELPPSWGAGVIALTEDRQDFWFDREHELKAIIIGAGAKTQKDGVKDGTALDVTKGRGFDRYTGFFTGWIDEVRIWDGARTATEIANEWNVRYTAELAAKNRSDFYDEWKTGKRRYEKDGSGKDVTMLAELRFHWAFDSIFGAQNEEALAVSPHAFDGQRAKLSRPVGYGIAWWQSVLDGYGSLYDFGRADWVSWIPNTVAHLPRFDGTTLDSVYWCEDFEGAAAGTFRFARTAEPVSLWTQYVRNGVKFETEYQTTGSRHFEFNTGSHDNGTQFATLFRFAGRNLNQSGDDLLPLGGAYAKSCDAATGLWDGQGPSSNWEITGEDPDGDGLPKWWETYADENYRGALTPAGDIGWKTVLDYNGMAITAGEAFLRDLAKGSYMNEFGEAVIGDDNYLQIADEDANGVPDWWADIYGIRGESGLADHDNDGLPNYVEYLLSEVFQFKVQFDPTVADSVREGIPDYFYRPEGCQLYVGEIFTDHDLVDDAWEDLYDEKDELDSETYASRLAWDAFADTDQDGWSNRSENRYAKAVMPIVANKREHNTPADGLVADYPIPTIALKLSYNGNRQYDVSEAPIAVQVTTETSLERDPDATYLIGAAADKTAGTGTTSETAEGSSGTEVARTRTIGKWSDRRVIGTLTPGNIKIDSIKLQNCYDPSSVTYSWKLLEGERAGQIRRGTHAEYNDDLRKYGEANVELLSMTAGYKDLQDLELRGDEKSVMATWFLTQTGDTLGTVNLVTGEFSLDLGKFRNWTVHDGTNENERAAMEDQTFRIAYATNPSVGLPRELYLGEADTGHVKEGKNTIIAWAETVAADGKWQVGEPYGIVRDVDVSWRGTKAEIELTDLSPVTPRIDLTTDESDRKDDNRAALVERIAKNLKSDPTVLAYISSNAVTDATIDDGSFRGQHIRVVRWLINDKPTALAGADARVVLDKTIETDVRTCLTEADFLVGKDGFDIDSANLTSEVTENNLVFSRCGNVTNVTYLIVVGDGDTTWSPVYSNKVCALQSLIVRRFGTSRVKPVAVAPGAVEEEIVHSANPTFKWTMACPEAEGYTAFRLQVLNASGKVVYDSGLQDAPSRIDGTYVWEAPLYVGDKTLQGAVFENKARYSWKVAMYNSKFSPTSRAPGDSNAGSFFMEVQTNGYTYGTANVAVRYFGPKSSYQKSYQKKDLVIRVRAYTSPDFTGLPVAAGYVANPDDPANGLTAGTNAAPNCTVVGIPRGTYYLQAFIDSNANGVCDKWETQGYLCTRDGSTPDYLDPTAITFDSKVGKGDLAVIYLEDADTDADGLPDAWEYAEYGSLTAKGVELLSETKAGEFVVNTAISGALKLQENANVPTAGLAGEIRNTMTKLRSPVGVSAATGIDPVDVEVTDGGLVVKSEIDPETLTIVGFAVDAVQNRVLLKVGAETTADINPTVANFLNITVKKGAEVTVKVEHAESPNGPWTELKGVDGTVTVDRAGADLEVKLSGELPAQGYFRAKVEE